MRPQALSKYDAIHLAALAKRDAGHEAYARNARLNAAQVARELEDYAFSDATTMEVNRSQLAALWPLIGDTVATDVGMEVDRHRAIAGRISAMHRAINGPGAASPVMPSIPEANETIAVMAGPGRRMATAMPWALLAGGIGAGLAGSATAPVLEGEEERYTTSDKLAVVAAALGSAATAGTVAGRPRQLGTVRTL